MSRRTAERARAVRQAWEREQQLVASGQGTRDWTPDQQQSILDIGVALDDEGKPFEGQHMKSVAAYPEYAGNPDNIQFLTRKEHLEAHDGNWQNPTNWYFDPITHEKHVFGDDLIPCKIIPLSDPIRSLVIDEKVDPEENTSDHSATEKTTEETTSGAKESINNKNSEKDKIPKTSANDTQKAQKPFRQILADMGNVVKNFSDNHPVITGLIKVGFAAGATYVIGKSASGSGSSSRSNDDYTFPDDDNNNDYSSIRDNSILTPDNTDYIAPSSNDDSDLQSYDNNNNEDSSLRDNSDLLSNELDNSDKRNYPEKRSSPCKHMVSGKGQHYNTKNGRIWIDKAPYPRGGKKNE